jgi:hypothetical protein
LRNLVQSACGENGRGGGRCFACVYVAQPRGGAEGRAARRPVAASRERREPSVRNLVQFGLWGGKGATGMLVSCCLYKPVPGEKNTRFPRLTAVRGAQARYNLIEKGDRVPGSFISWNGLIERESRQ